MQRDNLLLQANFKWVREMFRHGVHAEFSPPARMTVCVFRETATPFLDYSGLAPTLYGGYETCVAGGDELRPVIEAGLANASARQPSAHAAAFIKHAHAATSTLQFRRR